jgi:apolipoprotein N-acyltransferase
MKSWIVTLTIMYFSWHFTDVRSESALYSVLLPLITLFLALYIFLKILAKLGLLNGGSSSGGGFGGDGGGFGGDGGGCD